MMKNNAHEMDWPKPIPGFSCLKMKQEIQEKFYQETKDMTTDELLTRIREGTERFDKEQQRQRSKDERQKGKVVTV